MAELGADSSHLFLSSSIGFHRGNYDNWCGISFTSYLGLWMWYVLSSENLKLRS